jgi:hypothetical protein
MRTEGLLDELLWVSSTHKMHGYNNTVTMPVFRTEGDFEV